MSDLTWNSCIILLKRPSHQWYKYTLSLFYSTHTHITKYFLQANYNMCQNTELYWGDIHYNKNWTICKTVLTHSMRSHLQCVCSSSRCSCVGRCLRINPYRCHAANTDTIRTTEKHRHYSNNDKCIHVSVHLKQTWASPLIWNWQTNICACYLDHEVVLLVHLAHTPHHLTLLRLHSNRPRGRVLSALGRQCRPIAAVVNWKGERCWGQRWIWFLQTATDSEVK